MEQIFGSQYCRSLLYLDDLEVLSSSVAERLHRLETVMKPPETRGTKREAQKKWILQERHKIPSLGYFQSVHGLN